MMKQIAYISGTIALACTLAACKIEEKHTIEYFRENAAARAEQLKKCELMDNAEANANCRNASEAVRLEQHDRERKAREKYFGKQTLE